MLPSSKLTQATFDDLDSLLADNFVRAAKKNGIKKILFVSGLMPDKGNISKHLQSRKEVEDIFLSSGIPTVVLRAGMIIGAGSSSFVALKNLVGRLPVMICPSWTRTKSQSLDLDDLVKIIFQQIEEIVVENRIYDLGIPTPLSYAQMMEITAKQMGLKRILLPFPSFSPTLSVLWVNMITGAPRDLLYPLVKSLKSPMLVNAKNAYAYTFCSFENSVTKALKRDETPYAFQSRPQTDLQVRSVQRLDNPAKLSASDAANLYLRWLPQFLTPMISVHIQDDVVEFRFPMMKRPLLVMRLNAERSTEDRTLFYITGGLLVAPHERARLEFHEILGGKYIFAAIHNFQPRLPWFIYTMTQAKIHLFVMRRFGRYLCSKKY